jgi:hypothetical protein
MPAKSNELDKLMQLILSGSNRPPRRIWWKGLPFLAIGRENDFAIATQEEFDNFEPSTAHRMPNGTILRYGRVVGHADEITFVEDTLDSP